MCACSAGLDDAPYAEVSSHLGLILLKDSDAPWSQVSLGYQPDGRLMPHAPAMIGLWILCLQAADEMSLSLGFG